MGKAPSKPRTPSMIDVAEHAGVSQATVSFVMTDRAGVAEETRQRVLDSARELGYRPNRLASGLLRGKSGAIGVAVPAWSTEFSWWIFRGLQQELARAAYVPILMDSCPPEGEGLDELEILHRFIDYRVEGIILYGVEETLCRRYLVELHERRIPVAMVDHEFADAPCDHVGNDNTALGRAAATFLYERGFRTFGHLAGPDHLSTVRERRRGFVEAAAERGANVRIVAQKRLDYGEEAAEELARELPAGSAVFASYDMLARTLYRALARRGRTVPGDVALLGAGNSEWGEWLEPGLSTFEQNPDEIGRRAVRLMLARIQGRETGAPRREVVPFELLERGSTRGG